MNTIYLKNKGTINLLQSFFNTYTFKKTVLLSCTAFFISFLTLSQESAPKKVLIFSKTKDYRHESTEMSIEAIKNLCVENGIQVESTENSKWFNTRKLKEFDAVLFLNSSGDVFNERQQKAFQGFIRSGGGFVGIHGASTTEYEWGWFGKLIGGYFNGHPEPQNATIIVNDTSHLATKHLPISWNRFDEWYNFRWVDEDFNTLLSLDETTYTGGRHKDRHPIAWYKSFEGGRMFYTALGHTKESYTDNQFLKHVLGGILYALDNSKN